MGVIAGANINDNGLIFSLDAANYRSYSGSGNTSFGLVGGIGGTLVNGVGYTSTNGGSFIFDGSNDYIDVPDGFTSMFKNNDNWTISFWLKKTIVGSTVILSGGSNVGFFDLFLEINNDFIFYVAGRGASGSWLQNSNVSSVLGYSMTGKIINICFTKNNTTGYCFVDSVNIPLSAVGLGLGNMPNIDDRIFIGTFKNSQAYFSGNLYQIHIYNRALTAKEIKQNYNATKRRYGL
jgi:hypothetical protein